MSKSSNLKLSLLFILIISIAVILLFTFFRGSEANKEFPETEISDVSSTPSEQPEDIQSPPPSQIFKERTIRNISEDEAAIGGVPEFVMASIQKDLERDLDQKTSYEMFFVGVKKYDKDRMVQFKLTEKELAETPTPEALEYFFTRPFMTVITYHSDDFTGAERLLRVSKPLQKLIEREDFPAAVLKVMQQDFIHPDEVNPTEYLESGLMEAYESHFKKNDRVLDKNLLFGILTTHYLQRNTLLMHPEILKKLSGNELDLIRELARQHQKMHKEHESNIKETYQANPGPSPVNMFINFKLAAKLLEQYDENLFSKMNLNPELNAIPSEVDSFFEKIVDTHGLPLRASGK